MFTVSIIGPDGVGKTTIVTQLQKSLPMPVKYVYMGDNVESSNYILPWLRWWKKRHLAQSKAAKTLPKPMSPTRETTGLRAALRALKKSFGLVNRMLDVWYRYLVAAYFARRGYVVLLDRHFVYDYYHFDIEPQNGRRPLRRRLNGFLLKHTLPDPDLVICLDAPAEVIFRRKGEFSVEYIESRRQQYRSLQAVAKQFALVDANRELDTVVQDVRDIITNFESNAKTPLNPPFSRGESRGGKRGVSNFNGNSRKILVTDASRGSAVAIIRSLGRKGYRVVAADFNPKSLGFRSRYANEKVVYPAPENDPDAFCDFILETVKSLGVDLIIPVTDLTQQPLANARAEFAGKCKLAIASQAALDVVTDKDKTVELAQQLGVPVPKTFTVYTIAEAQALAEELGWPVVVKPQISRLLRQGEGIEKYKVTYAGNSDELAKTMGEFEGRCAVLLQRYLPGEGHGVELLLHEGRPLAAFQHHRLREVPVTGGPSSYRESFLLDPQLYDYSVRMMQTLRWTGLAMVEFKVGDGRAELMEINGRVWGSLPLAVASGVDFPFLLAQLHFNGPDAIQPNLNSNYKLGLKCRDLGRDFSWMIKVLTQQRPYKFLKFPSRVQAVAAFLGLFNPRNKFDLLCWDDPLPGLAELPMIYRKFWQKKKAAKEKVSADHLQHAEVDEED
jgi:predicted ATP-grasp superfamily ATP-dependent carboligase/thymidylate kinase